MRFTGTCYGAHTPSWAYLPLSGEGASLKGGRFNQIGRPTLYLSFSIDGAIIEASRSFNGLVEPLTVCSYEVDCENILDLTDAAACQEHGIVKGDLSAPWQLDKAENRYPASWLLANRLIAQGIVGIIVPSFANRATPDMKNLVLWTWTPDLPHKVSIYDPSRRLPVNQLSWPPA